MDGKGRGTAVYRSGLMNVSFHWCGGDADETVRYLRGHDTLLYARAANPDAGGASMSIIPHDRPRQAFVFLAFPAAAAAAGFFSAPIECPLTS